MERCRAILEIAVQQNLDMPEIVWKTYINIELANLEIEKVRSLYCRLLNKTKHVKVWISYAKFEQENQENLKFCEKTRIYLQQIKKMFKSKSFILLLVAFSIGLGIFNAVLTLLQQIFCVDLQFWVMFSLVGSFLLFL